jgi:LmbE family N-acetylglucosaminyl deacetylase/SAM-dependent methyltransferase
VVTFDGSAAGTSADIWESDPRLHDRRELDLESVTSLLVVAAHPDDETLGAGGLIAACAARGIRVRVVVVTDGAAAPPEPGTAARRAREVRRAVAELAPAARLDLLGFADGGTSGDRAAISAALAPIIAALPRGALVAAPWRGDGHVDHEVVGAVCAELAAPLAVALVEYPIWLWHWARPDFVEVPWDALVAVPSDRATKSRALAHHASQIGGPRPVVRPEVIGNALRADELFVAAPPVAGPPAAAPPAGAALPARYFDELYAHSDDPWGFASRWYEERKRALTLAALPDRGYATGLELGCSIGVLTEQLAERVDDLLAVDVSQAAVDRARERVGDRARVERADLTEGVPAGRFDLIVLSEVGYYLTAEPFEVLLDQVLDRLADGGALVACHWRHPVDDYPVGGDEVHARLRARGLPRLVEHLEDDFVLEVFSTDPRSVARRAGLA